MEKSRDPRNLRQDLGKLGEKTGKNQDFSIFAPIFLQFSGSGFLFYPVAGRRGSQSWLESHILQLPFLGQGFSESACSVFFLQLKYLLWPLGQWVTSPNLLLCFVVFMAFRFCARKPKSLKVTQMASEGQAYLREGEIPEPSGNQCRTKRKGPRRVNR